MASQGPNSGATFADDATVGTVAWTNPGNAAASDNNRATAVLGAGVTSHYLKATNFSFSIPTGSTILGILVEVERSVAARPFEIFDNSIKIVKGGTISGNEKSAGAFWPTTDAYTSFGGAADLWGVSWTAADINGSGFGVVVSGKASASGDTARIDHIRITVTYTPPSTQQAMII